MKKSFSPRNRHFLVEPVVEEKSETAILLPEDYSNPKEHIIAKLVSFAPDANTSELYEEGDILAVNTSMVQAVDYEGVTYHLVLENYVLGVIK